MSVHNLLISPDCSFSKKPSKNQKQISAPLYDFLNFLNNFDYILKKLCLVLNSETKAKKIEPNHAEKLVIKQRYIK